MSPSRLILKQCLLIGTVWIASRGVQQAGAFYHLTSPSHPCRVTSPENETVDVICQYKEGFVTLSPQGTSHACDAQKVIWQRADYHLTTNITDTNKYGVWEAVPGWKMAEGQRISLLRIRNLQPEDMGVYQCRIQCRGSEGRIHVNYHMADLCLNHGSSGDSVCATRALDNKCSWAFNNAICDPECDNEENLYDGFDCSSPASDCHRTYDENCRRGFANGICDTRCDSMGCAWDGGDCIDQQLVFAEDKIVITLASWYQRSGQTVDVKLLGRSLSMLLRSIVRVIPYDEGKKDSATEREATWHLPDKRGYNAMRKIYVKIDNTKCRRRCFHRAEFAAKFIDMALKNKWDPGIPISSIGVLSRTVNKCDLENNTLLHIDLPVSRQKETNPNIYSYTLAESSDDAMPPTWLLVTAIIGGIVILALVLVIVIIILRIRKLSKEERHRAVADIDRIQEKSAPQGTDV